jgi:ABC-type transport system substrate-binding protein
MSNILRRFWPKKWPSKNQWKHFSEVISKEELYLFLFFVVLFFASFICLIFSFYFSKTEIAPFYGETYNEGVVQSTRWLTINPLYASQSDIENDLIEIVFSGLMRFDKSGEIVPHLAKECKTEDGKIFELTLRDDLYWSDGEKITADDIVFTVKTILNPDFQSTLRPTWVGVKVEKISDYAVLFTLEKQSAIFLENLTLKIIPQHIFENSLPNELRYSLDNMNPVGSGPYRLKEVKKNDLSENIETLTLERNPYYFLEKPFLNEVVFHFYKDEESFLSAVKKKEIDGFVLKNNDRENQSFEKGFTYYNFTLPRYFSALFNLHSKEAIKEIALRRALNYGTDKKELLNIVLNNSGIVVNSPLLPDFYNLQEKETDVFDIEKAKEILVDAGFENGKKETEKPFTFTKDLKMDSKGDEVRKLQECFIFLREEDKEIYPQGDITGFFDEKTKTAVNYFQEKYREEILDPQNFKNGTGMVSKGTRKKLNEVCKNLFDETVSLEVTITTTEDPFLVKTAEELKNQWSKLGIKTVIDKRNSVDLREEVIRPRNFEILLFGTMLPGIFNPLPLWHSTKVDDPGLNISGYESKTADELLEKIISSTDKETREESFLELEEEISKEVPGVFLFNPYFTYAVNEKIKGITEKKILTSSSRFEDIGLWYVNTKRVIKK